MSHSSLPLSSVNGVLTEKVSVRERGLAYGDGVFETLLINEQGVSPLWERHRQRLAHSLKRLQMPVSSAWWALLDEWIIDLVRRGMTQSSACDSNRACVLKIIVTRGVGGRGYQLPDPATQPSVILQLMPLPSFPAAIHLCAVPVPLSRNRTLAGLKHLNKLEYVLAAAHAISAYEPLLMDTEGWVIESLSKNLFVQLDGQIITPALDFSGVAGVQRSALLSALGADVEVASLNAREFASASAVVATNALVGVLPVHSYTPMASKPEKTVQFRQSDGLCRQLCQRLASVEAASWEKSWLADN